MIPDRLEYRSIKRKDYEELAGIIGEAFELDAHAKNHRHIKRMIMVNYFLSYMKEQNYTEVALLDGKPVGCIIGRIDGKPYPASQLILAIEDKLMEFCLKFTKIGRDFIGEKRTECKADTILRAGHRTYDGELVCFAVSKECRGQGVGKHLMEDFRRYAKQCGTKHMFLYTDSFCNVNYYRANGFTEVAEERVKYDDDPGKEYPFYLFEFTV